MSRASSCLRAAARVSAARGAASPCSVERACRPHALPACRAPSARATRLPPARPAARHRRAGARSGVAAGHDKRAESVPRERSCARTLLSAATARIAHLARRWRRGCVLDIGGVVCGSSRQEPLHMARYSATAARPLPLLPRGRCPRQAEQHPDGARGAVRPLPVTWHALAPWRRARRSQQLSSCACDATVRRNATLHACAQAARRGGVCASFARSAPADQSLASICRLQAPIVLSAVAQRCRERNAAGIADNVLAQGKLRERRGRQRARQRGGARLANLAAAHVEVPCTANPKPRGA